MPEMPQLTVLGIGLLLGMRHALDADHVAAVSTILSEHPDIRASGRIGIFWGVGHTVTLFLLAVSVLLFQITIPTWLAQTFEFGVGVMLVILGASLIQTLRRNHWHVHAHDHGADRHVHLHSHIGCGNHEHTHRMPRALKACVVGMVHGLAGSSGLLLIVLSSVHGMWQALSFVLLFGVGSIVGMLVMGVLISLPLLVSHGFGRKVFVTVQGVVCAASVAVGVAIMVRIAVEHRFFY